MTSKKYKVTAYRVDPVTRVYKAKSEQEAAEKMEKYVENREEEYGQEFLRSGYYVEEVKG
ncbi:hypothetical protein [Pseudovibrio exalbescens]|uniref:hypothetical protein n=1 Tax=Pseudovibrio exalbescens TaxID=197461 RepID=UPI000C9B4F56|nr:hypothetical protein [Pseudovibrio exalbescens]